MTIQDWAAFILAISSITGIVLTGIRWYINFQVKPIQEAVQDIRKETKTNGGSSMRDEIRSIKNQQEEDREIRKATSDKLDHMYEILIEFIARSK